MTADQARGGRIRVGTSGWTYPRWRGDFYPGGLVQREELRYAAERMGALEVNGSFYSLQRPTTYAHWREQVPDGVELAVKGGRFVTHLKRLRDVEVPLANFFASGVLALGPHLGPMLWQLPERQEYDAALLADFFALLPRTVADAAALARRHDAKVPEDRALTRAPHGLAARRIRHALEFRSATFCTDEAADLMRRHDVATVVADTAGRWPTADAVTSDLVYVRLHGDTELYASGYSDAALDRWAERCRGWAQDHDVVVFFDNDARGHAPHDALRLIARLGDLHVPVVRRS
ncbi:DUF72 domain-containing protein [Phycicoccus sp. MAQZ13P-2]|uniref:DUF72 domain-containing protein n=1 Tax=Phycicoccus mangrovi TaxID=2840470 RepID=UPI001C00472B|nr:DUF72 domain-containing protein [Phycicoccus mangrovi]MBT9256187.1 DUF72 domain-containing protein [Phycicoccus mangrovi]MBT9273798.1 DUF72 domain-containing protein [Phycicoccus mangrovi]